MTAGKPDNLLRKTLHTAGVCIYRMGLASTVIKLTPKRIRTLLYHAVEPTSDAFTADLNVSVTPEMFAANLDYFKKHYNVVPMSTIESGELPERPLTITFDDGYYSVYQHAMPALHQRDLSACVYLITRAVQGRAVWVNLLNYALHKHHDTALDVFAKFEELNDVERDASVIAHVQQNFKPAQVEALCDALLAALPPINTEGLYANEADIHDMQAHGLHFGFHTRDHYNLRNCTDAELEEQLDNSGCTHVMNSNTFAYPFGYFNTGAVSHVESQQYKRIMTVGNNNNVFSQLHLDRTEVFTANPADLFAQLEVVEPIIAKLRSWMVKPEDDLAAKSGNVLASDVNPAKNAAK